MFKLIILMALMSGAENWQSTEKNGMKFTWKMEGDYMECIVESPGKGWIAIGFNERNTIVGSNLIMGAAEKGHFKMSDRYVVKFGQHESVLTLGVNEALLNREVIENKEGTIMKFKIKRKNIDQYHLNLEKGKSIYVWLAYSMEDDFDHHSIMRTSIQINL